MNNKLFVVMVIFIGGCASTPYAVIDGSLSKASDPNNHDVSIVSIDGKMEFNKKSKKNVKPGFHYINLLTTKKLKRKSSSLKMFPVEAKECTKYVVTAQHKNNLSDEWEVRVLREVPIPSCTPSQTKKEPVPISEHLKSAAELSCFEADSLLSSYSPADLYPAVKQCISEGKAEQAIYTYTLASAYGAFDVSRVVDKTAHDAINAIQKHSTWALTALEQDKFQNKLRSFITTPESMNRLCAVVEAIGKPSYYPSYMVEHGVKKLPATSPDGLVQKFNGDLAWSTVMAKHLNCTAL
ncbi:hypothetical protein [Shewanella gelidii]|uniref:hypothetical protein n=1 Tax=Shewanella gelidii TaxID=1642821 RepID=UPI00166503D1|nr:hypothetical protein [Shewanella gelidii]MCL1097636.1 hypothetical protein [Shewanella gelidii]